MYKFVIPAAALLLVTAPALTSAETTRTEESVEQYDDEGNSKSVERSVETEREDLDEEKSVETTRTEKLGTDDAEVETERSEKTTVIDD